MNDLFIHVLVLYIVWFVNRRRRLEINSNKKCEEKFLHPQVILREKRKRWKMGQNKNNCVLDFFANWNPS